MPKSQEFGDFSGGVTDKSVPGVSNSFLSLDNVLLDQDKKIYTRSGFDIYSSAAYNLNIAVPVTVTERVSRLINFKSDYELYATQNKKFYYISSGAWTALNGPTGNNAFNTNTASSLVEHAEWNSHLYLASDSSDQPIKVYRDGAGTIRLRTAGIPSPVTQLGYTETTKLTAAYNLAVDIRDTLNLHANNFDSLGGTAAHQAKDTVLDTAMDNLVIANTLASVIAAAKSLRTNYNLHVDDARLNGTAQVYHAELSATSGPNIRIKDPILNLKVDIGAAESVSKTNPLPKLPTDANIDTLDEAIRVLNDVRNKYNWHIYAPSTHQNAKQGTVWAVTNAIASAPIQLDYDVNGETYNYRTPVISRNLTTLTRYVNAIKTQYNVHLALAMSTPAAADYTMTQGFYHRAADTQNIVRCPDASDLHSAVALVANLEYNYANHYFDANQKTSSGYYAVGDDYACFTGTVTAGSNTIASVTPDPTTTLTGTVTDYLLARISDDTSDPIDWLDFPTTAAWNYGEAIAAVAATTIAVTNNAAGSSSGTYKFAFSRGRYHFDIDRGTGSITSSERASQRFQESIDFTLSDISTVTDFVAAFAAKLKAHETGDTGTATGGPSILAAANILADDVYIPANYILYKQKQVGSFGGNNHFTTHITGGVSAPNITNYTFWPASISGAENDGQGYFEAGLDTSDFLYKFVARYDYTVQAPSYVSGIPLATVTVSGTAAGDISVDHPERFAKNQAIVVQDDNTAGTICFVRAVVGSVLSCVTKYDGTTAVDLSTYTTGQNAKIYETTFFRDLSAPSEAIAVQAVTSESSVAEGDNTARDAIAISSIPALANISNQNFDTSNISIDVYRTTSASSVYYKVGELTNGTTTFSDTVLDADLINNEQLYTNGGALGNDMPPASAIVHVLDNRAYYAVGNRLYQSKDSDLDAVHSSFFDQFEESIVSVSSTRANPIVLTTTAVYRVSGAFDDQGNGGMTHERIYDGTGCVAQQSVVRAGSGVFFAGKDGFYFTDGVSCFRTTNLDDTFTGYTTDSNASYQTAKRKAIQGSYDSIGKRIYWTILTSGANSGPDVVWVMDLKFGVNPNATPITTFSGGSIANFASMQQDGTVAQYTGFRPTSLAMFNGALCYGDSQGYVFRQDSTLNYDLNLKTTVAATSWTKRTIFWDVKSCHSDYGTEFYRKYFLRVGPVFEQKSTNLSVQVVSDADKGRIQDDLPLIRSRKLVTAAGYGDPTLDWLANIYTARSGNLIDEFRRFKANGSLRSNFRALEFKNAYCVIVNSTEMGTITIANVAGNVYTLTLTSLVATRKWPTYAVDYYVKIAGVSYPVTVRTSDSVIRVDTTGLAAISTGVVAAWELWGYPKGEKMRMVGFNVSFETLGNQQKDYQGTTSQDGGENA